MEKKNKILTESHISKSAGVNLIPEMKRAPPKTPYIHIISLFFGIL